MPLTPQRGKAVSSSIYVTSDSTGMALTSRHTGETSLFDAKPPHNE